MVPNCCLDFEVVPDRSGYQQRSEVEKGGTNRAS